MSPRPIVHPLFDTDVIAAVSWYEEQSAGLGERFEQQLNACLRKITERPKSFQLTLGKMRQARLKDFPYSVVFELHGEWLLIHGVFHTARDRGVWESRS